MPIGSPAGWRFYSRPASWHTATLTYNAARRHPDLKLSKMGKQ
jgi:hypothetical protein